MELQGLMARWDQWAPSVKRDPRDLLGLPVRSDLPCAVNGIVSNSVAW